MKLFALSTLLAFSTVAAPNDTAMIQKPTLDAQSGAGAQCLEQAIAQGVQQGGLELYDFEGPYQRDDKIIEYRVYANRIRYVGFIIQLTTNDREWKQNSSGAFTATSLNKTAPVYEFLRGGDLGNFRGNADLAPCEKYLQ